MFKRLSMRVGVLLFTLSTYIFNLTRTGLCGIILRNGTNSGHSIDELILSLMLVALLRSNPEFAMYITMWFLETTSNHVFIRIAIEDSINTLVDNQRFWEELLNVAQNAFRKTPSLLILFEELSQTYVRISDQKRAIRMLLNDARTHIGYDVYTTTDVKQHIENMTTIHVLFLKSIAQLEDSFHKLKFDPMVTLKQSKAYMQEMEHAAAYQERISQATVVLHKILDCEKKIAELLLIISAVDKKFSDPLIELQLKQYMQLSKTAAQRNKDAYDSMKMKLARESELCKLASLKPAHVSKAERKKKVAEMRAAKVAARK